VLRRRTLYGTESISSNTLNHITTQVVVVVVVVVAVVLVVDVEVVVVVVNP
jgi:hypothetical protein